MVLLCLSWPQLWWPLDWQWKRWWSAWQLLFWQGRPELQVSTATARPALLLRPSTTHQSARREMHLCSGQAAGACLHFPWAFSLLSHVKKNAWRSKCSRMLSGLWPASHLMSRTLQQDCLPGLQARRRGGGGGGGGAAWGSKQGG